MKQAIVIATTPQRYDILQNLLDSISGYDKYLILILSDYSYFEGKIKFIIDFTDIDEFIMIADSMEFKDTSFFELIFEKHKGKSVSIYKIPHSFYMVLGKFKSDVLRKIPMSFKSNTFKESDDFAQKFGDFYTAVDPDIAYLLPQSADYETGTFIDKFDRKNMVVENQYFIKYKVHWSTDTLPNYHVTRT